MVIKTKARVTFDYAVLPCITCYVMYECYVSRYIYHVMYVFYVMHAVSCHGGSNLNYCKLKISNSESQNIFLDLTRMQIRQASVKFMPET